jgi:DNA primase
MAIDFESFVRWCEDKFDKVIVKGHEVRINSVFTEDEGQHLWCSPRGGKHYRQDGCYRCFKTDKKGTLIGLVMIVDNCSHDEAKEILSGQTLIGDLEQKLEEFFKEKEFIVESDGLDLSKMRLPIGSFMIDFLPKGNATRLEAERYLATRKLSTTGLYICTEGDYKNRIIIPYYDPKGNLIYFNGRSLANKGLRYLGPDKTIGVGKGDVIFAPKWPIKSSKIYLTEGEFDAITLCFCGYNGMACGGKYLSENQIQLIRDYKVCLALDEDPSGLQGVKAMADNLMANQVSDITYVRPPQGIKDWNKMLVMFKSEIIRAYITANEKQFDDFTNIFL